MPGTAQIAPKHQVNRDAAVRDMATALLRAHQKHMARCSYRNVVQAALSFACEMTEDQWLELGRLTGHYTHATEVASETISDTLALLQSMVPADGDPFEGLAS